MISALTQKSEFERSEERSPVVIRKAVMRDIGPLLNLINGYAAAGIMLARTEFEISENIRDFSVAYVGESLVGCGALHFYSPIVGEIRSLAVAEKVKVKGIGRLLVEALVQEATQFELGAVFAFTYVPEFFGKLRFCEVERGELPLKAWKDCLRCPKFTACDEIAVLRIINETQWAPHTKADTFEPFTNFPIVRSAPISN